MPDEFRGRALRVQRLRDAAGGVRGPRLHLRLGLEGLPGDRPVSGIELPAGLRESEQLPEPIFTPSTKAEEGHDEAIDFEQTAELIGDRALAERLRDASSRSTSAVAGTLRERGVILADTKFEFGLDPDGALTLGDEVCTPDSSRFWPADSTSRATRQPCFDKQYVRDWAAGTGWDKSPPAPPIPDDVVAATRERYVTPTSGCPASRSRPGWSAPARVRVPGPDPPEGRDPRPAGPGGRARAARARVRGRLERPRRRLVELDVRTPSRLDEMCERLLANPLIEDYEIQSSQAA